jgi:hypothetical protein
MDLVQFERSKTSRCTASHMSIPSIWGFHELLAVQVHATAEMQYSYKRERIDMGLLSAP